MYAIATTTNFLRHSVFVLLFLLNLGALAQQIGESKTLLIGTTYYDFIEGQGRKFAPAKEVNTDGIHFIFDNISLSTSERMITYNYYDIGSNFFYGNMDVASGKNASLANGLNDGAIITLTSPTGVQLIQDVGEANYFFTTTQNISGASGSGFSRQGNTAILLAGRANGIIGDTLLVSEDNMQTWIGRSPSIVDTLTTAIGTIPTPLLNPQDLTEFSYLLAPDITSTAPNGSLVQMSSTDNGATWSSTEIHDDDTQYTNHTGNMSYAVEDFADINGIYDAQGNLHVVAGAVQGFLDQTRPIFPILYWNVNDNEIEEVTNRSYGRPSDSTTQANLVNLRPGNGLGNAYPQIARVGADYLFAVWQQWETNPDGSLRTLIGSAGQEIFVTDIWGSLISNSGNPYNPFKVAGTEGVSDVFPRLPEELKFNTNNCSYVIELAYLQDTDPGVSILGQNNPSLCQWMYTTMTIELLKGAVTSKPGILTPNELTLEQNYPNPFNPATTINYTLKRRGSVQIELFGITGRKLQTLLNEIQNIGNHSYEFQAGALPSGVYFYTISSNNQSRQTKKMVLLK
ncbi:MAG: T9SS type A sorting domain-containing protein [Calditrichia bacterium]